MTPLEYYRQQCEQGHYQEDPNQVLALAQLQEIRLQLMQEGRKRAGLFSSLRAPKSVQGLYLWGGVGIGKTFVMDCFYHTLPFNHKMRMHFHQFMNMVQGELKRLQGLKNPLALIAKDIAKKALVLCLDEFIVADVADAMILERLLNSLFAQGVCLVTTSNTQPDELYKQGLQRQHFLPAIALLKRNLQVMHVHTKTDYRLLHLKHAGVFYIPNDEIAQDNLEKSFTILAAGAEVDTQSIQLLGREVPIRKSTNNMIWFDFKVICSVPRSHQDYLALVKQYQTFFISDLRVIGPQARDKIVLFIRLIDVLYDAGVRLVLSAETSMDKIYSEGRLLAEYKRTLSRLVEMQSEKYFTK